MTFKVTGEGDEEEDVKKNVWTSDKSWEPGSFLMFSYVFQCFLTFSNVTYSHSHSLTLSLSLSHSLTFSLSHSHTLEISHWITLDMLNNFCFHLDAQNSLSHSLTLSQSLTLTLTHSHTLSISHSITLDMLNNFCFHVYAQKSLLLFFDVNAFFWQNFSFMLFLGPRQHPHLWV